MFKRVGVPLLAATFLAGSMATASALSIGGGGTSKGSSSSASSKGSSLGGKSFGGKSFGKSDGKSSGKSAKSLKSKMHGHSPSPPNSGSVQTGRSSTSDDSCDGPEIVNLDGDTPNARDCD